MLDSLSESVCSTFTGDLSKTKTTFHGFTIFPVNFSLSLTMVIK